MITIGIAGAGNMATMHALAYKRMANAKVAAIADVNFEKAGALAELFDAKVYGSIDDMIRGTDIEMIDVCLPTFLHKASTIQALDAGLHVFCEKPVALNTHDANEMLRAAKRNKRKLMVGHCLRFSDNYRFLKKCLEDRRFGRLLSANFYRHSSTPLWSEGAWLSDKSKSGGMILDLHIHDVDMIVYLLGVPEAVTSYGADANISTLYEYPDTAVYAEASWRMQKSFPFCMGYDAVFETATVKYANNEVIIYDQHGQHALETGPSEKAANSVIGNISEEHLPMYRREIEYFIECIRKGEEPMDSMPESSVMSLEIALAEIESLSRKEKIPLPVRA